jgi:hypothetical protein
MTDGRDLSEVLNPAVAEAKERVADKRKAAEDQAIRRQAGETAAAGPRRTCQDRKVPESEPKPTRPALSCTSKIVGQQEASGRGSRVVASAGRGATAARAGGSAIFA